MKYIEGQDRTQTYLFPVSLDQSIEPDNEVRFLDLFVESLDLKAFGFKVDLSLQPYKIFDVIIYDENQTVRYSDQSTNVVKTVDTFNLTNGTYYLHIYDGSDLLLSAILIINH